MLGPGDGAVWISSEPAQINMGTEMVTVKVGGVDERDENAMSERREKGTVTSP